ncbi:MAG: hypothetical protein ACRCS9_14505 [Hyphomicrobium sp.]
MSTDYAEKERLFVTALAEDSGRDLDAWMQAIAASGLTDRNAIIDWLRQQGFMFSKASWLERIHHNGGKLIYAGNEIQSATSQDAERAVARQPERRRRATRTLDASADMPPVAPVSPMPPALATASPETAALGSVEQPSVAATSQTNLVHPSPRATMPPKSAAVAPNAVPSHENGDIAPLLAAAKGLRPLADHLLRELARVLPGIEATAAEPFIALAAPGHFASLLTSAKELRLYADFGDPPRAPARRADARVAAPFAGMIVLADVRQIDADLLAAVTQAYQRASIQPDAQAQR